MIGASASATNRGIEQRRLALVASQEEQRQKELDRLHKLTADLSERNLQLAAEISGLRARLAFYDTPRGTVRDVISEMAEKHDVRAEEITGVLRTAHIVIARQEAMYEARQRLPHLTIGQIARVFRRDHTTVLHGVRAHKKRMQAVAQ